jgi:hypothetical protein
MEYIFAVILCIKLRRGAKTVTLGFHGKVTIELIMDRNSRVELFTLFFGLVRRKNVHS